MPAKPKSEVLTVVAWSPAALLLAVLTWNVQAQAGQLAVDAYWADAVAAARTESLTALMRKLHSLQGKVVAAAILLWAAVLARRKRWTSLLSLLVMVPFGMLANSGLKLLVERPRPGLHEAVGSHGYAYPSGHTVAITLLCGYVVVQVFRRTTNWSLRLASVCVALAVVALVAFSRVYLGVHHPSDVLAAVLLGVAWLGLCLSGEQWLGRRTRSATL